MPVGQYVKATLNMPGALREKRTSQTGSLEKLRGTTQFWRLLLNLRLRSSQLLYSALHSASLSPIRGSVQRSYILNTTQITPTNFFKTWIIIQISRWPNPSKSFHFERLSKMSGLFNMGKIWRVFSETLDLGLWVGKISHRNEVKKLVANLSFLERVSK